MILYNYLADRNESVHLLKTHYKKGLPLRTKIIYALLCKLELYSVIITNLFVASITYFKEN